MVSNVVDRAVPGRLRSPMKSDMKFIHLIVRRRQFIGALVFPAVLLFFRRFSGALRISFRPESACASNRSLPDERPFPKGIVVYYSGAGNTARVANAVYEGMKSLITCDVAPIDSVKPADLAGYDVVAVGSPNWFKREPANVTLFLCDMPRMDGKHCILFGTHGNQPYGQFWSMARKVLKKGLTIIGWNDWYGSDLLHGAQPDGEWGHPDEIDLAEAAAFGRQMAAYSKRIYAGEKELIPEIPAPDRGKKNLWAPDTDDLGNISFASPRADHIPEFDLTRCTYPRCKRCVEICPVNAIDFSLMAPAGSILPEDPTTAPVVLKEACQHCGGLCERVCLYDAIRFEGEKMASVFDMEKCTYPKCTVCVENCPQDAIDFSVIPPVIRRRCEGGDRICFAVCPENAIEYPAMAEGHPAREGPETSEAVDEAAYWASHYPPGFRPHIRVRDIGSRGDIMSFTTYPRFRIDREHWPYHITEG